MKTMITKNIVRFLIQASQMLAVCLWCFFLGTATGLLMLIVGFIAGCKEGEFGLFYAGICWNLGQLLPILISAFYRNVFGVDEWLKNESFFVY